MCLLFSCQAAVLWFAPQKWRLKFRSKFGCRIDEWIAHQCKRESLTWENWINRTAKEVMLCSGLKSAQRSVKKKSPYELCLSFAHALDIHQHNDAPLCVRKRKFICPVLPEVPRQTMMQMVSLRNRRRTSPLPRERLCVAKMWMIWT